MNQAAVAGEGAAGGLGIFGQNINTAALIDACLSEGGRFFLPYQLHYTAKQLLAAYPQLPDVLAKKRELDPRGLFTSTWYRAVSGLVAAG